MEGLGLTRLFGGAYAGRRVLVTGHTGFKGSWLAMWLHALGAEVAGLALEPDTAPSHWSLLRLSLVHEVRADLRDAERVRTAVHDFKPEIVFHLAAQSLVRRGYRDPVSTFDTNVRGLVHILEAVRGCEAVRAVVNATTDKVYEPHDAPGGYRESDPLGGHDPYSASKACAELVSSCYQRSYFTPGARDRTLRLATARAGNVVGGGDWAEDRLVPDMVRAVTAGTAIKLRNPDATRPWQHVLEPLSGYLRLGQALLGGEVDGGAWNFGPTPDATLAVGDVVRRMQAHWSQLQVVYDPGPHPHEAARLTLDCSKSARLLDWHPVWDATATLAHTAHWYHRYLQQGEVVSHDDLAAYVQDARAQAHVWAR